ncbi:MAG: M56 family metallopeptidase [Eubacteriales bacterium]|nr:M56 family metallopeptidase [Eubacteriales bacterium]
MEQTILTRLLEILVYSTAIFLIVWLFRSIFSKMLSPQLKYALWFLVVLRLCIPVTFESGLHLFTLAPSFAPTATSAMPAVQNPVGTDGLPQTEAPRLGGGTAPTQPQPNEAEKPPMMKTAMRISWQQWLLIVWAAGFTLMLGVSVVLMIQLRLRLRRLGCEPGEKTGTLYEQIKQEMRIRGRVPLLLMPDIKSPALTVEPSPRLLLPDRLIFAANAESMAFAMAHELMHYKRKDYLVCLLLLLLRAVYWFHPVAWALLYLMRLDMETACDSMVVARFDRERKLSYVNLLLALGEETSPFSLQRKTMTLEQKD